MKISCQACGTKYTIADDKVRGRKVRVRCKSCSTPIVVDTAQAEAEAQAEAAAAPSAAPPAETPEPWTVNLSDTEQRTMTTEEIVSGYHSGTVTDDAFVWKEGMGDWIPVLEQAELRAAIEAYGTAAPQPAEAPPAPAPAAFPAPAANLSPFGTATPWAPPVAAAPAAAPVAAARLSGGRSQGAADLFGSVESAGSEEEESKAAAALPGSTAYDAKVTGARNENSVLFSLDSLKAGFAAPAPKPSPKGAPPPKRPGARPGLQSAPDDPFGMSSGNSGMSRLGGGNALFSMGDNQALMMAPPPPPEPPPPPVVTDPVGVEYAPAPAAKRGPDKRLFIIMGSVAVLVLVVGVGLGVALSGGKKDEEAAQADTNSEKSGKESDKDKKTEESKPEKTAETKPEETKPEGDPAATSPSASAAEKKPPTEEEKKRFAEAQKKEQEKKETEKPGEKKPELPIPTDGPPFNKGAAISALSSAASASTSCKRPGGPTGSGKALVTFAPSGRVTSANVTGGSFGGTSVGGCVASVFRRAKVPPFGGQPVTVSKSFSIKP